MAALTPDKFKIVGFTQEDANRIDRPTISYWQDAWRRLKKAWPVCKILVWYGYSRP